MIRRALILGLLLAWAPANAAPPLTSKQALQPLQDLIGEWRGTGTPEGTPREKQQGFWTETIAWQWQFQGQDAWLRADFEKGKHFRQAELRYDPKKAQFTLNAKTASQGKSTFEGPFQDGKLVLDRLDADSGDVQRLVITPLHSNRFLYRFEVKPKGKQAFARLYQVGATKEGVPFAAGDGQPECIVSGGLGTISMAYKGKTYYVCCSGCRTAFKEDPEKYIKELEEKKAAEKKPK